MLFLGAIEADYEIIEAVVVKDGIVYEVNFENEEATILYIEGCDLADLVNCDAEIPEEIEVLDEEFEVVK